MAKLPGFYNMYSIKTLRKSGFWQSVKLKTSFGIKREKYL